MLLDSSGLYAAIDGSEPMHTAAASALVAAEPPLLLSPFVLAEVDYLVSRRRGVDAELSLLEEVAEEAYSLAPFTADEIAEAAAIIRQYHDQRLGLADASIVVLAHRYGARDVLTLDHRHFRALRGPGGRPFRLLPADVPAP
jgi:uncharacterized protein